MNVTGRRNTRRVLYYIQKPTRIAKKSATFVTIIRPQKQPTHAKRTELNVSKCI